MTLYYYFIDTKGLIIFYDHFSDAGDPYAAIRRLWDANAKLQNEIRKLKQNEIRKLKSNQRKTCGFSVVATLVAAVTLVVMVVMMTIMLQWHSDYKREIEDLASQSGNYHCLPSNYASRIIEITCL